MTARPHPSPSEPIAYQWRGDFSNAELNRLHAACFDQPVTSADWHTRLHRHSLGWVLARHGEPLVGFVNLAFDGGQHAIVLDTMVASGYRRRGVGTRLVAVAAAEAKAAGCRWLHVDFEAHLSRFYLDGCGFAPTRAGLLAL